jgi:hypothetical protein
LPPTIFIYSNPMPGIGEPPMLRNGNAKKVLWVCWPNSMLVARAFWREFCAIDGKALPNIPPPSPAVGKAMLADSRSLADCVADCIAVSDPFCTRTGKPQDIGVRLALTEYDATVIARRTKVNNTNLFTI